MSSEQSKEIAIGFIDAVNSCDASQVVDYYLSHKNFEAYFANPHRRRRMNYGYIDSEFDTKEEWLVLIREMWEFHNMIFQEYEYKVIKPWILCEGDKVLVPSQFSVSEPFRLKFSISVPWYFFINNGLIFGNGFFSDPLAILSSTNKKLPVGLKPSKSDIREYIRQLRIQGLIEGN